MYLAFLREIFVTWYNTKCYPEENSLQDEWFIWPLSWPGLTRDHFNVRVWDAQIETHVAVTKMLNSLGVLLECLSSQVINSALLSRYCLGRRSSENKPWILIHSAWMPSEPWMCQVSILCHYKIKFVFYVKSWLDNMLPIWYWK